MERNIEWFIPPILAFDIRKFVKVLIEIVATKKSLMICGPSGVGKSLYLDIYEKFYNKKHNTSKVTRKNIASLNPNLIESELFGHARGAFSGATVKRDGLIKTADGGLLIIEEIGEIPPDVQAKLLTFLDDGSFYPMGSDKPENSNIAIVTTMNKEKNEFRVDFWNRFFPHNVPPLYERRPDIFFHFYHKYPEIFEIITKRELFFILTYSWPGNVREIDNAILSIKTAYDTISNKRKKNDFDGDPVLRCIPGIYESSCEFPQRGWSYKTHENANQYFANKLLNPYESTRAFLQMPIITKDVFTVKQNSSDVATYPCIGESEYWYELYREISDYCKMFFIRKDMLKNNIYEISRGDMNLVGYLKILVDYSDNNDISLHSDIWNYRNGNKPDSQQWESLLRGMKLDSQQGTQEKDITSMTEEELLTYYYSELARETKYNRAEIGRRAGLKKNTALRRFGKYYCPNNGSSGS